MSDPTAKPKSFKDTLNLPATSFPMRANLAQNEAASIKRWDDEGLYAAIEDASALSAMPSLRRHTVTSLATFGALVEAALRIRHFVHTGLPVPRDLVREPWWPWGSTKAKLVHDERCRRGARLMPLVPENANSDIDMRKGVVQKTIA